MATRGAKRRRANDEDDYDELFRSFGDALPRFDDSDPEFAAYPNGMPFFGPLPSSQQRGVRRQPVDHNGNPRPAANGRPNIPGVPPAAIPEGLAAEIGVNGMNGLNGMNGMNGMNGADGDGDVGVMMQDAQQRFRNLVHFHKQDLSMFRALTGENIEANAEEKQYVTGVMAAARSTGADGRPARVPAFGESGGVGDPAHYHPEVKRLDCFLCHIAQADPEDEEGRRDPYVHMKWYDLQYVGHIPDTIIFQQMTNIFNNFQTTSKAPNPQALTIDVTSTHFRYHDTSNFLRPLYQNFIIALELRNILIQHIFGKSVLDGSEIFNPNAMTQFFKVCDRVSDLSVKITQGRAWINQHVFKKIGGISAIAPNMKTINSHLTTTTKAPSKKRPLAEELK